METWQSTIYYTQVLTIIYTHVYYELSTRETDNSNDLIFSLLDNRQLLNVLAGLFCYNILDWLLELFFLAQTTCLKERATP